MFLATFCMLWFVILFIFVTSNGAANKVLCIAFRPSSRNTPATPSSASKVLVLAWRASRTWRRGSTFPFLAVLLVLASGRVLAQPTVCLTDGDSPLLTDANSCADLLIALGNYQCCQTDCRANGFTTICSIGSATAKMFGDCDQCVPCQQAGNYIAYVMGNCAFDSRVAGYASGFTNPTVKVNIE